MIRQRLAILILLTHISERKVDALIKECKLTKAVSQNLILVLGGEREYLAVWFECDSCTSILAFANNLYLCERSTL